MEHRRARARRFVSRSAYASATPSSTTLAARTAYPTPNDVTGVGCSTSRNTSSTVIVKPLTKIASAAYNDQK